MARAIGLINANYFTKADPAFTLGRPLASLPVLGRYRMMQERGGTVSLMHLSPQVKRVYDLSGMARIIPVVEEKEAAE